MPYATRNNSNALKLFFQWSLCYLDLKFNVAQYSLERRPSGADHVNSRNGRLDKLALVHIHQHGRIWPMRNVSLDVPND